MTVLSVNINKIATLRNARGGNLPDVTAAALFCEKCGAHGITVHPRPDARHITYKDVEILKSVLSTEFNIEGNPIASFRDLVCRIKPHQVTLVPDAVNAITSNAGWDTIKNKSFLKGICSIFHSEGIRCSIFVDPDPEMVRHAADCGCDRIELYTQAYAAAYHEDREKAIEPYYKAAIAATECSLGINAGHDLNLDNLRYFHQTIPNLAEVSIGHAIICDALYMGLDNTIKAYLEQLEN